MEKREQEKRKVVGCYVYSRPDGDSLYVHGGMRKPVYGDKGYAYMYLLNTDGDISGVRRAVESLVKSLQNWLEDPENAASAGPEDSDNAVNAGAYKEGARLFEELFEEDQ